MRFNNIVILFLLYFFLSIPAFSQQENRPLREILYEVEQRFNISFTFLDEIIVGIRIKEPSENLDLSEVLEFLQQKTGLTFTQLDKRFITISKPEIQSFKICGVIVDKETDEKIAGAIIRCGPSFVVSNSTGFFELRNVDRPNLVSIKSLGYDSLTMVATNLIEAPCKTLKLTLQTSLLSEVIITNYLTTGIRKKTEGSISVRTKELGILPGLTEPDVLFTIQALPGIQSIDETVSNINVRGGTHDQNLVLWDGIKMYQQGHFFGLISAFNPYFTKEVSLIKNGTSARLSDGVSSTIDIRPEDEVSNSFTGGAGLNMINADVHAEIPLSKKASFHIATRRSIADLVETPTYSSYYDRAFRGTEVAKYNNNDTVSSGEKFHFYDFSAKFLYDLSTKDKLRVNFLQIHNSIQYRETEMVNSIPESKVSSLGQQNTAAGISYTRLWNSEVRTSGMLYASKYDLDGVNYDILNDQRLIQDNEVIDVGIKLDTRISLSSSFDLLSGYQFFEVGVMNLEDINNPAFYRLKKSVLQTHVLFSEANYSSPSNNTNFRAGMRANLFSEFNVIRVEPRFSINQKITESFSLELLGEMKSQATTQITDFQNDFLGVEKRRWVMANNQDIPIITSKQLSAGTHFNQHNFLIALEGYAKWVNNIITSSQGFQNQFQYVRSAGSYKTTGIDLLINRRISKLNSWISYSFAKSDYTFKALLPSNFPNNLDIRHRATWGISYQSTHFEISTGVNWHTGKPFTEPTSSNPVSDGEINYRDPNSSRLVNYWRIDCSAKYKFNLSDKLQGVISASIWNVLNHENIIDGYYQLDTANQVTFFPRNSLLFTPNVMLRVDF